jgi:two-component system, OmpR family, KDP operon response regulator KdpE
MAHKTTILVIDDEPQIRKLLVFTLEKQGYNTLVAETGMVGIEMTAMHKPDLVFLDLGLPDLSGMDVLARIREWSRVPVIILSVRDRENDKVAALDKGADDYLTKPFGSSELLARVRVALRHQMKTDHSSSVIRNGHITLDVVSHIATLHSKEVELTATELHLLRIFLQHAGKILTHSFLLTEVWGTAFKEETQYLRVYVGNLRKKFERDTTRPQIFITESGIGYRMLLLDEPPMS